MSADAPSGTQGQTANRNILWFGVAFAALGLVVMVGWLTGAFPLYPTSDGPFVVVKPGTGLSDPVQVDEERLAAEAPALHRAILEVNRTGSRVVLEGQEDHRQTWAFLEPYRDRPGNQIVILFQGSPYFIHSLETAS